jgi:hypothetical protein
MKIKEILTESKTSDYIESLARYINSQRPAVVEAVKKLLSQRS